MTAAFSPPPELREAAERAILDGPNQLKEAIDYVLVATHPSSGATPAGSARAVELPYGIRIEQIPGDLAERLMDACEPKGENWVSTRQFSCVHAYVRTAWKQGEEDIDPVHSWDHERRLYPCIQLSRLIRDNATSTEYAVQRLVRNDSTETLVPFEGYGSHVAHRLYPDRRGWLDEDEALELRRLLENFWEGPEWPDRVRRALRRVDAVTGERYLEDALPIAVGAMESLLKVGRAFLTAQFAGRVPKLAADMGVEDLDEQLCREIYNDRSAIVHGDEVDLSESQDLDEFGRGFIALQETLRRTVRRAIEEPEFAARFADDQAVRAAWPVLI